MLQSIKRAKVILLMFLIVKDVLVIKGMHYCRRELKCRLTKVPPTDCSVLMANLYEASSVPPICTFDEFREEFRTRHSLREQLLKVKFRCRHELELIFI